MLTFSHILLIKSSKGKVYIIYRKHSFILSDLELILLIYPKSFYVDSEEHCSDHLFIYFLKQRRNMQAAVCSSTFFNTHTTSQTPTSSAVVAIVVVRYILHKMRAYDINLLTNSLKELGC